METSDELEGVELAVAVGEAQGMTKQISRSGHAWFDTKGELWTIADKGPDLGNLYRPDRNIAQAWELDGEGWRWLFSEKLGGESFKFGSYAGNLLVRLWTKDDIFSYVVAVNPADFATKAHAYATARCRAYLKAKGADNDNE